MQGVADIIAKRRFPLFSPTAVTMLPLPPMPLAPI
jgi:hypothetical protein